MHFFHKRYLILYLVLGLIGLALVIILGALLVGAQLVTSAPLAACPPIPTDVNSTSDSGCGTLRFALSQAQTGDQVRIDLTPGSIINITSGGLVVPAGVSVTTTANAPCNPATGPAIAINGTGATAGIGLTLNGGSTIYGVRIFGFSGQQIKATAGPNTLTCVKASRPINDLNISITPKTGNLVAGDNNLIVTLTPLDATKRISAFTLNIIATGLTITSITPVDPQQVLTKISEAGLGTNSVKITYVVNKPANQLVPIVQLTIATQTIGSGSATVDIATNNTQVVGNFPTYKYSYFSIDQGSYTIN
jgi:hypothetical protein